MNAKGAVDALRAAGYAAQLDSTGSRISGGSSSYVDDEGFTWFSGGFRIELRQGVVFAAVMGPGQLDTTRECESLEEAVEFVKTHHRK